MMKTVRSGLHDAAHNRGRQVRLALLTGALVFVLASCGARAGTTTLGSTPGTTSAASLPAATPTPLEGDQPAPTPPASGDQPAPSSSPALGKTKVTIVSAGADDEAVYASGIVTGDPVAGGVCTLTATSGEAKLTADMAAQATPAAVNCGLIRIQVPSGTWMLTLSYSAESITVESDLTTVHRP